MPHGSSVFVTVTARNAADLIAIVTSDPVLIDLTAPIVHYVIDGGSENGKYYNRPIHRPFPI